MEYKAITLTPTRIEFSFPFSMGMKNRVKALPGSRYDPDHKTWYMPVTEDSAKLAVKFGKEHGFIIDKSVLDLGRTPIFTLADAIRSKMYPFQVEGLDFLHTTGGRAIVADEMGLGKTITALGFIQERGFVRVLLVVPASVIYKWQDEIYRWIGSHASILIVDKVASKLSDATFTIMSYTIFTKKIDEIRKKGYQIVVYDECHYLGNKDSKRTRAATSLVTPYVLGLSGTPFLNKPIELWPTLNIISQIEFGSYWKYAARYCGAYQDRFGWNVGGASNLSELRTKLQHIFLRRTKQEVMSELPSLTRVHIPIEWDSKLSREYNEALRETKERILKNKTAGGTKLQQIARLRHVVGIMKVNAAVELAEDVLTSKQKVVLFAHHKSVVAELCIKLGSYNTITIVGDTPQEERFDNVYKFQNDPDVRVAIISQAGGEGIDLYAADVLIFVEREWNPGKEAQIEGRLHRIGQQSNVEVIYLIARNTIDERIHNLIERKREVFGQIISLDDIPILDLLEVNNGDN